MGKVISFVGQKGGGSKSATARTVAVIFSESGWKTHLCDFDDKQQTSFKWSIRRENAGLSAIDCAVYRRVETVLKVRDQNHLLIVDSRPAAESSTLDFALHSDLVVITTGTTVDDLEPSLQLGREIVSKGTPREKVVFLVAKAPSETEGLKAQETIKEWGFRVLKSVIPFKTGYGNALDSGRALHETPYKTLNETAQAVVEEIHDIINS